MGRVHGADPLPGALARRDPTGDVRADRRSRVGGLAGIFVALPLLAVLRAIWEFAGERLELEDWRGEGPVPVEVEVEPPVQEAPVPPRANVGS